MIKITRNLDEVHSLKEEWNKLAEPFKHPTLRHEWFISCAKAFYKQSQLRVIVISDKGEIKAIAPLVLVKDYGIERLEFIGMSLLFETGGFIYKNEESLKELYDTIIALRKTLILRRIRSEAREVSMSSKVCHHQAVVKLRNDSGTPFISMTNSWEAFEAAMSTSDRAILRRKERQVQKKGRLDFEVVSPRPDNIQDYLNEVFHVEASGWKGKIGTAILSMPLLHKFFNLYCQMSARIGMLRIFFLRLDDKAIAVRIAVEYANRLWELKIGYSENWARYSPGLLLTHKTIKYAFENGLDAYEFMGNDAPWIHMWTKRLHSYTELQIYPFTFGGMISLGISSSRYEVSKFLNIWK